MLNGHLYRGGTSKCWLFTTDELRGDHDAVSRRLIDAFGSGDARQLDGVGGGTSTTSKAALVSKSAMTGLDVSYLFAQVGIEARSVEFTSNCGNCASAVALFALDQKMVKPTGDVTRIRMLNENTGGVLQAEIDTPGGQVPSSGEEYIPGVLNPAIGVDVAFEDVDGISTGELFPTGSTCERLVVDGRNLTVSNIDAGAPASFVLASSLGATGAENSADIEAEYLVPLLDARRKLSHRMGLTSEGEVPSPAVPKIGLIGEPREYTTLNGEEVGAGDYDISARMISMFNVHPAIGITAAVALARSAMVDGTTTAQILGAPLVFGDSSELSLRIGTLSGVIVAKVLAPDAGAPMSIGVKRTARHLADSLIHVG